MDHEPACIANDLECESAGHGNCEAHCSVSDSQRELWDDEDAEEDSEKDVARKTRSVEEVRLP